MAGGQFRHANSKEEIAKREAREASGVKDPVKGFRHYNHPEEVAKRAREEAGPAPAPKTPVVVVPPAPVVPVAAAPATLPAPGTGNTALHRLANVEEQVRQLIDGLESRLDQALADLFGTPEELQALRVTMANLPAIQDQAQNLRDRVKALEDTWDMQLEALANDTAKTDPLGVAPVVKTLPPEAEPDAFGSEVEEQAQ